MSGKKDDRDISSLKRPELALKEKADKIVSVLKKLYPDPECALDYRSEGWRLMVMGRLSAQCKDVRVNEVCIELFGKYPSAEALSKADIKEVEKIIRPCGLYHMKAADIVGECLMLVNDYGGILPDEIDELLKFPGVGRKIANLLVSDIYGKPAIVADTHCIRISGRLGLTKGRTKDPLKVERELLAIIDESETFRFCHRLVDFGREICSARSPSCEGCPLSEYCDEFTERYSGVK